MKHPVTKMCYRLGTFITQAVCQYPIITINNVVAHLIYFKWAAAADASLRCGLGPHQYKPRHVKGYNLKSVGRSIFNYWLIL